MDIIRGAVRSIMRRIAKVLNTISGGRISPNSITLIGLLAHIGIAYLIALGYLWQAGILLIVFGLFDTLDGELARLQHKASTAGMVLDSVTDRVKEVMLYVALASFFVNTNEAIFAVWAVAACGSSLLVSYVNAWGEAVASSVKTTPHATNKTFRTGFMTFDVRMLFLVVGLIFAKPELAVMLIAVLAAVTAGQRLLSLTKRL